VEFRVVTHQVTAALSADMLNTTTTSAGMTMAGRRALELPVNLRHVYGLTFLHPGVNDAGQRHMINNPRQHGYRTYAGLKIPQFDCNLTSVEEAK
jgi:hypothetical protein